MKFSVSLLCPFDVDFEPDIDRIAREAKLARVPIVGGSAAVEIPRVPGGAVTREGELLAATSSVETRLYGFGAGVIRIELFLEGWDLARVAAFAARAEDVELAGQPISAFVRATAAALRTRFRPFARAHYETLLDTVEVYPVIRAASLSSAGDAFVAAEQRALAAIVSGDARQSPLSSFATEEYRIRNIGPLAADAVVVREAGAFFHISTAARGAAGELEAKQEERRLESLLEVAYAQYWALRGVDLVIQSLQDQAYRFIASFLAHKFRVRTSSVTRLFYRAREEHMAIATIIDDLLELPARGYDAYVETFFHHVRDVFEVPRRSEVASQRLTDLERSYEAVHQMLAEQRLMTIEVLMFIVIAIEFVLALLQHGRSP